MGAQAPLVVDAMDAVHLRAIHPPATVADQPKCPIRGDDPASPGAGPGPAGHTAWTRPTGVEAAGRNPRPG